MAPARLFCWTGVALVASTMAACSDDGPRACLRPAAISGDLQPRWSVTLGNGMPVGMRLRADGSLVAAVYAQERLSIAGTSIPVSYPSPLVVALDPDGKLLWHRLLDGTGLAVDLAVDGAGNTHLVGKRSSGDVYLAKLAPDGEVVFARDLDLGLMKGAMFRFVDGLAVSADAGQVVVAGTLIGGTDSGHFIARYDAAGTLVSARHGGPDVQPRRVVLDGAGGVLVTGDLSGDLDWGPTQVSVHHGSFALYLDAGDQVLWARTLGEDVFIDAVAFDSARGRAFLAVPASGPIALDGSPFVPTGLRDLVVVALDDVSSPSSTARVLAAIPAGPTDRLAAIASDGEGGLLGLGEAFQFIDPGAGIVEPAAELLLRLDGTGRTVAQAAFPASTADLEGRSVAGSAQGSYLFGRYTGAMDLGFSPTAGTLYDPGDSKVTTFVAAYGAGPPVSSSTGCTPPAALSSYPGRAVPAHLALAGDSIIVATQSEVMTVPAGGGASRLLAHAQPGIAGIAVAEGRVVWATRGLEEAPASATRGGSIVTVPLGGGEPAILYEGPDPARAIAIQGDTLYWTAGGEVLTGTRVTFTGSLFSMRFDGGSPAKKLASGFSWVGPVVAGDGIVAFAAGSSATVGRIIRVDSNGAMVDLATAVGAVTSLAIDGGRVYWTEGSGRSQSGLNLGRVRSAPLEPGEATVLADAQSDPDDVIVLDGQIYWRTTAALGPPAKIWREPVAGGAPVAVAEESAGGIVKMAVDRDRIVWIESRSSAWSMRALPR